MPPSHPTRRAALRTGIVGVGALAASSFAAPAFATTVPAPRRPVRRAGAVRPLGVAGPLPAGPEFLAHLLRRTTYGVTPELVADVAAAGGPQGWLDRQLAPEGIADHDCDRALARFPLAAANPQRLHAELANGDWDGMQQLQQATFTRAVWSKRQLFEVMVEFWSNHLNITCPSSDVWATRPSYDTDVVRRHALGRFEDMLIASATSPAMLQYLDNASSRGVAPNENYGRELLELHTVGRDAGYGQAGVIECARALTGLTVWNPWNGGTPDTMWTFRYNPDWHYTGPVRVLGWSHPNADKHGGVEVAASLCSYLAHHPATAQRLARKLALRFVSDDPPRALVDRLAGVYLESGTAVLPVLRALFASEEFAESIGRKYRRPYEDVVATVRAMGAVPNPDGTTRSFGAYCWLAGQLGQAPLAWPPPDGYPDVAPAWVGTGSTVGRWNLHVGVAGGWWKEGIDYPGTLADRMLPGGRPADRHALADALFARLVPGLSVPAEHREALVTFLGGAGPVKDHDIGGGFYVLVALVLDSALWTVR